jgi:hypothetical protein
MKQYILALALIFATTICTAQSNVRGLTAEEAEQKMPMLYPIAKNVLPAENYSKKGRLLEKPIAEFFGNARGTYVDLRGADALTPTGKMGLRNQFINTLSIVDGPYLMPNGYLLHFGTFPRDSFTHSIIVTGNDSNQVLATALLHKNCGRNNNWEPGKKLQLPICDDQPTLTIFYSGRIGPNLEINKQLSDFIEHVIKQKNLIASQYDVKYKNLKIEVRVLNDK